MAGRMSNKEKILKCEAIPKNALSDNYVSRFSYWNKWNGLEINDHSPWKAYGKLPHVRMVPAAKRNKLRQNYCRLLINHESSGTDHYTGDIAEAIDKIEYLEKYQVFDSIKSINKIIWNSAKRNKPADHHYSR